MSIEINDVSWSHFKRLFEMCSADPKVLNKFISNPNEIIKANSFDIDANTALDLINKYFYGKKCKADNPYLVKAKQILERVYDEFDEMLSLDNIENDNFRKWISRHRKRLLFESLLVRKKTNGITVPFSFELSYGCSGNCPFCFLSAGKLESVFRYTKGNAQLWNDILEKTKKISGKTLKRSICYFATEPFDNPDYEKFILDFKAISGFFPQTTTASALRDISRTKRFISMLGGENLRFAALRMSVISLDKLYKIHEAFSPEELCNIELLINNPESFNKYSNAGRARNREVLNLDENDFVDMSSNCIAGFVVNMPNKTIKLVIPVIPDDEYPLGVKTYDETTFTDVQSYENAIMSMINKWMPEEMPFDTVLRLNSHVALRREGDYMVFVADGGNRLMSADDNFYSSIKLFERGTTINAMLDNFIISDCEKTELIDKIEFVYDLGYLMC